MAERWKGGVLDTIGITPQFITQTLSSSVAAGVSQTWRGAGQSFFTQAGSALVGGLAGSAINIGLNKAFGTQVANASGIQLGSGSNILASAITPYVTSAISSGLNQQIQKSLKSAGPFGTILSSVGTTVVNRATQTLTNRIFGQANGGGFSTMFPGGGGGGPSGQSSANYGSGGVAYSNPTVVFSIIPANQGPKSSDIAAAVNVPPTATTVPLTQNAGNTGVATPDPFSSFSTTYFLNEKMKGMQFDRDATFPTVTDTSLSFNTSSTTSYFIKGVDKAQLEKAYKDNYVGKQEGMSPAPASNPGWTFICAPKNISWSTANAANRVDMFGTNSPPVVTGTRGMRELAIGEAIIEGFTRGVNIEDKISALEDLLNYKLNSKSGYVDVPVYRFKANDKDYASRGYFILKEVRVQEMLRDGTGKATRATVDIGLIEVPKYQVSSGRDQASRTVSGATAQALPAAAQAGQTAATGAGQIANPLTVTYNSGPRFRGVTG